MNGNVDELLNGRANQCSQYPQPGQYMPRDECFQIRYNFKQAIDSKFDTVEKRFDKWEDKQEKRDEKMDKKLDAIYTKQDSINVRLLGILAAIIAGIVVGIVMYVLP